MNQRLTVEEAAQSPKIRDFGYVRSQFSGQLQMDKIQSAGKKDNARFLRVRWNGMDCVVGSWIH
jgi:hypothetical protein